MRNTTTAKKVATARKAPATRTTGAARKAAVAASDAAKRTTTAKAAKAAPAKAAASKAAAPTPAKKAAAKKAAAPAGRTAFVTVSGRPHPADEWARIIERDGLSIAEVARRMDVRFGSLHRVLKGGAVPTAGLTIRFAAATSGNVKVLWQAIADFELAEALAAAKQ